MTRNRITYTRCVEGVPEGTRVAWVYVDTVRQVFWLVLEHPSFVPVPPGGLIPERAVWVSTIPAEM